MWVVVVSSRRSCYSWCREIFSAIRIWVYRLYCIVLFCFILFCFDVFRWLMTETFREKESLRRYLAVLGANRGGNLWPVEFNFTRWADDLTLFWMDKLSSTTTCKVTFSLISPFDSIFFRQIIQKYLNELSCCRFKAFIDSTWESK